ncbi:hypothetical protein BH10BAC3_BH10BAC3_30630 [soil metagenome]
MTKTFFLFTLILSSVFGYSQTADFTFQSSTGSFCTPATIQFKQNCTGNPIGFIWDLGIAKSYEENPSISYSIAGNYTVTLTAVYDQKVVTISKTIQVFTNVTASVSFDRNSICKPGNINFTAITNGNIANYVWDFGDGSPIAKVGSDNISHFFSDTGVYNISLTATSQNGCSVIAKSTVTLKELVITATMPRATGCIPQKARFTANVLAPVNSSVTNYAWDFGDGSPVLNTSTKSTLKTYSATGKFSPKVTVTTDEGCTAIFVYDSLKFGTPPTNLAAYVVKNTICGSDFGEFVANANNATNYRWNFGDGVIVSPADTLSRHRYDSLGTKTVQVTPLFNNCAGKTAILSIKVIGVKAKFTYANTCSDKKTYDFLNTSQGNISSIAWSFGDLSPNVNTINAKHTFPTNGSYSTSLSIVDNITGCKDLFSKRIYTANPSVVNSDLSICKNTTTTFTILNSYTNTNSLYKWDAVGRNYNADSLFPLMVIADSLGSFNNTVIINYGIESCPDTVSLDHKIVVKGPELNFAAPTSICFKSPFVVQNNSKPFLAADVINNWSWNFGADSIINTAYQPGPYLNKRTGKYTVTLAATDINGCTDTLIKNYSVNRLPFVQIVNSIDTVCLGQPDSIIAFHSDSIRWSPTSLLSCSNCDTIIIKPVQSMQLFATAPTAFNCTVTDSIQIKVFSPVTASVPVSSFYICPAESVQLSVNPPGQVVSWSPATGLSNSNSYKPVATPMQRTIYTATLTDSANCFRSNASVDVIVKTPPTVNAGPDVNYPYNTTFSFAPTYSGNINLYLWQPAQSISCNDCAVPSGVADEGRVYTVTVVSDSGCVASDSVRIGVLCSDASMFMATAFTPNNDNLNDYYYPLVKGIKLVKRFAIFNRFGEVIFEAKNFDPNDKTFGWNGKYKGKDQPFSTYIYILDAICEQGETIQKHGSFVLMR